MIRDRVEQTSTTAGTGTYSLTGSVAQRQTFVGAGLAGTNVYYLAIDSVNGGWEIGIGLVTDLATDTLTRATIIASSNGNLAVNWPSGTRNISGVWPAELGGPISGRLKYGAAGGSANAITVANPIPLRALTGGAIQLFRATADNSGAVTLNVDGTGATPLRDWQGTALPAGAIKNGQMALALLNEATTVWHLINPTPPLAASETVAGVVELATEAEMEAAIDAARVASALNQRHHPAHPKAWCLWDATVAGTNPPIAGYNVTSVQQVAAGRALINFTTPFATTNYAAFGMSQSASVLHDPVGTKTVSAFPIRVQNAAGTGVNDPFVQAAFYGIQ